MIVFVSQAYSRIVLWMRSEDTSPSASPLFGSHNFPFPKALWLILMLSLALNWYGIGWGLPSLLSWAPDEINPTVVRNAMAQKFSHGWHSIYPPFHYYILSLTHLPFVLLDRWHVIELENNFTIYTALFYAGRFINVLMGTSIVFGVYLCGCELYAKRGALFAALITAMIAPFVYYAKIINLDVPYMFWLVASLWFYLRILKYHRIADYLLFTATAVCSVCTKDQAVGFFVLMPFPIIISEYLKIKGQKKTLPLLKACLNRKTILSLVLGIMLFGLIHNVLFNFSGFIKHVQTITTGPKIYQMYENTIAGHAQLFWLSIQQIRFLLGWPMFVLCITGFVVALINYKRNLLLFALCIPAISYYLFSISMIRYTYARFLIPYGIFLALFAGQWLAKELRSARPFYPLKTGLLIGIFVYTCWYAASVDILMTHDSRYYVETWMDQHIDKEAKIGLVGLLQYLPRIGLFKNREFLLQPTPKKLSTAKPDYLVLRLPVKSRNARFYKRLEAGKLGYTLIFQYHSVPKGVILRDTDMYMNQNGQRFSISNLNKINPEINIFKRND